MCVFLLADGAYILLILFDVPKIEPICISVPSLKMSLEIEGRFEYLMAGFAFKGSCLNFNLNELHWFLFDLLHLDLFSL